MRSVKGIIIGFLLILLGFAAAQYSLVAAGILAAGGLAVVVVSALPKKIEKQPQEPPAAPAPVKPDLSSPEQLPDILTAPPVQPEPPAPPQPEAEALYKTLAEAYTRIEGLSCRGPAWMLERDIRLCKAFCARWNGAQQEPQTAALLREKVRFVDYSDEFLLPGFGRRGRIPGRCASGDLLEDLSAAVLKQTARQQTALEAALRAQIHALGMENYVTLLGMQSNPYPILRQTDLFVQSSRIEAFGLTITEAQALGVPVLSTKTDGGTELIRDEETGLLCDISAEAIEDGVRRLLRDKALYDRIREGTAGIDFESRNAHVMQRLYEELERP